MISAFFIFLFHIIYRVICMKKILSLIMTFVLLFSFSVLTFAQNNKNACPVDVKAKSAILMEVNSGSVLAELNADKKLYPASVTKIMTILLAVEAIDNKKISLKDNVTCSENAASKGGSQIWLEQGEVMTVDDLLKATVIGSANDAATLLGEYISGDEKSFVALMNTRAKELGMNNTHFVNATGLDDDTTEHLSTARDIGIMSCELLKHKLITNYSTVWMSELRNGKTELVNTNKLVRFFNGTTGLKTGTTDKAGCCVSASCERDGLHLVAVVMGSDNSTDRFESAKSLLNWGFSNYTVVTPQVNCEDITDIKVINGEKELITPKLPEISSLLVKKGEQENIKQFTEICKDLEAPVDLGQKVGTLKYLNGNTCIAEYDIISPVAVARLSLSTSFKRIVSYLLTGKYE